LAVKTLLYLLAGPPIPEIPSEFGIIIPVVVVVPVTASVPARVTADKADDQADVPVPWMVTLPTIWVFPCVTTSPKLLMIGIFYYYRAKITKVAIVGRAS
jgi:hypothetical protein